MRSFCGCCGYTFFLNFFNWFVCLIHLHISGLLNWYCSYNMLFPSFPNASEVIVKGMVKYTCYIATTKQIDYIYFSFPFLWRYNGRDGVSNHQPHDCLLSRLFRRISKKTSKPRVTCLCAGNSPATGEFPSQMACYAENASIWWRHHAFFSLTDIVIQRMISDRTTVSRRHRKPELLQISLVL